MKCVQDCRTFLWGGAGVPGFVDADGDCSSCVCDGEGWSAHNILGAPSCVPTRAHLVFGVAGCLASMAGLFHAANQLRRQVNSHVGNVMLSSSPIERCRWHLHAVVITHVIFSLCFFLLVLVLDDDLLWISAVLMCGIMQYTINIGGLLTTRMWIYTNDHRLMQETPEILAISNALQRPVGQRVSYCLSCMGATVGTVLALTRDAQVAIRVASVAFMSLVVFCNMVITRCAKCLMRTIDKSLEKRRLRANKPTSPASGNDMRLQGSDLVKAKKKLWIALSFCRFMAAKTVSLLLVAVVTKYGTAVPLILFGIPVGFAPLVWFGLNIQLHAGRSSSRAAPVPLFCTAQPEQPFSGASKAHESTVVIAHAHRQPKVIPMEALASP